MKTPVLLLVFKRLETIKEVVSVLQQAKPERIFIASDGPRINKEHELTEVLAVRDYLQSNINWPCEVSTLFRERNLGCGKAVSTAIDWFFSKVDSGIILEDDCVPDLSFFNFCEVLLKKYANDEEVMSISGTHFGPSDAVDSDYYFSKYPLMWGWATWKRAWDKYSFEPTGWKDVLNKQNHLSFRSKLYWYKIFSNLEKGLIDTWDYQWILTLWKQNGLVCRPRLNLVRNIGFGADATHTYLSDNKSSKLEANYLPDVLRSPSAKTVFKAGDVAAENDWMNLGPKSLFGLYMPRVSKVLKVLLRLNS